MYKKNFCKIFKQYHLVKLRIAKQVLNICIECVIVQPDYFGVYRDFLCMDYLQAKIKINWAIGSFWLSFIDVNIGSILKNIKSNQFLKCISI